MINLAHISPNQNAYSETFIQSHKNNFDANVRFYYGDHFPKYLEGKGLLWLTPIERVKDYLNKLISSHENVKSISYKALKKSFIEEQINVVYAEYGLTGIALMELCKELDIPLIVNFHGYEISTKSIIEENKENYKKLFESAQYIVAVSKLMMQTLIDLGCDPDKIVYTPCAPNDLFFDIHPIYSENSFLSVGRFVDKKAPYYTILAFRKVVEKYPDAKLYIAGEGELFNSCRNLSRYYNLDSNIQFLGKCTHQELINLYQKVKGFVQHSITAYSGDMEGTPVAVLEASASALPVISTKHAGIPDVVIDNVTGLLVEEHDVDGMAADMIYLIENEKEVMAMGEAGRKYVKNNFSTDIHMRKLNQLIRDVVKNKK